MTVVGPMTRRAQADADPLTDTDTHQYLLTRVFHHQGNKVSSVSETRQIEVGSFDESSRKKHNKIKTSKYSLLWFLPKNLSEQFRRVVNFYFLIVTVIAIVIGECCIIYLCFRTMLLSVAGITVVRNGNGIERERRNDNGAYKRICWEKRTKALITHLLQ